MKYEEIVARFWSGEYDDMTVEEFRRRFPLDKIIVEEYSPAKDEGQQPNQHD
jgi:hypothetical protein